MGQKKGMPTWGWVLIGCGGIVVLGMVVMLALGAFVFNKAQDFAEDLERNPAYAAAKVLAFADSNIEVVDSDDEKQTVTIRNKQTDETVTLNLEDIENGKIEWITKDGKVTINANEEDGMVVTSGDQKVTYGGQDAQHPDWVPVYPGSETKNMAASKTEVEETGVIFYTTDDDLAKVAAWYKKKLEDAGFKVSEITGNKLHSFSGSKDNDQVSLVINAAKEDNDTKVSGTIQYGKKNL